MVLIFRVITRILVIGIAYLAACIAATFVLVAVVVGWSEMFSDRVYADPAEEFIAFFFQAMFGVFSFGSLTSAALPPFAVAALVTEGLSLKSWVYHVAIGGGLAVVLLMSADVYKGETPPQQDIISILAAGFVAGFIYWLFAGRNSGSWRVHTATSRETAG